MGIRTNSKEMLGSSGQSPRSLFIMNKSVVIYPSYEDFTGWKLHRMPE